MKWHSAEVFYRRKTYKHTLYNTVQFSHSVVSDSLQPHRMQHARPPCLSPTPGACSNSCPLSQWCHPTILSPCHPLLLLPSIFPSIRIFSNDSVLRIRWPKYCIIQPVNKFTTWMLVSLLLPFCFKHLLTWFCICIWTPRTHLPTRESEYTLLRVKGALTPCHWARCQACDLNTSCEHVFLCLNFTFCIQTQQCPLSPLRV